MPLIVRNITLDLNTPEEALLEAVARKLRVPGEAIRRHAVVRKSLDARRNRPVQFVYTVELTLDDDDAEERILRKLRVRNVDRITPKADAPLEPGSTPLPARPLVIGFGPAGMFAALRLAEMGYRPLVLERGRPVRVRHKDIMHDFYRERVFNPESNLLYGEGGAGTYSDGKVYTRISDPGVREVLAVFVRFGASPEILQAAKPHIGSDRLPTICRRLREHLETLGAEIRFDARLDDVEIDDGEIRAVRIGDERIEVGPVLLGIGHSARDTLGMLHQRGVLLEAKPFQFGVRIEHPQTLVNTWQYGPAAGHDRLPPADYHLIARGAAGDYGDLYSFCMCPGGMILPTNESPGLVATNGASRSSRGGAFANSGFVITVRPEQLGGDPLAGLEYQRQWEARAFEAGGGDYHVPAQRCADFLADRGSDGGLETSYPLGGAWQRMESLLPPELIVALKRGLTQLEKQLPGFAGTDGIITAPESRASTPVRITRDRESRESVSTRNLYPIGEGAGYAGGIVSAAIDGIRSAESIVRRYRAL